MDKLKHRIEQEDKTFKKIGEDIKELKNKIFKSYIYDISNTEYTKLCSVSVKQNGGETSLYLLLNQLQESKADNTISFSYIRSKLINNIPVFEGIQENKVGDIKYKLYSQLENGNTSNYSFQRIKQDNGTGFNLILGTKELAISAPASGYRKYNHTVENNVKTDTENRYYTASMLITPNELDTQDTKFFDTIILGNSWTNRIGWANFKKIKNEDGSVFLYQTFLVNREAGRQFVEFSFICENGSTKNATKVTNIKVEEGNSYTPYVKAFSELPANSNGVEFLIKGLPGLSSIATANAYVHIAYADTTEGGGFSEKPDNKSYIGVYTDNAQESSTEPSNYKWSLISDIVSESADVITIPCTEVEGKTPYLHLAYADDASGTHFSGDTGKPYIGYLLDNNQTNREFTIYVKSEEANQKIQVNILALNEKEAEITFFEESQQVTLENASEFNALSGTIPTWQEVTEQGSTTTKPVTISNQLNVNNLLSKGIYNEGNVSVTKGSVYVGASGNSQVMVGSAGIEIGYPSNKGKITSDGLLLGLNDNTYNSQFFIDCGNKEVGGNDDMKNAFNKWLGLEQKKYGEWDFDWQFHPDLSINGFSALKTGKQVMITAFLSINTTTETSYITLFKIPEGLKGDQNIQFINQLINIPRFGRPMSPHFTIRELEYASHIGNVTVSNTPMNGVYDDFTDFNNCEFRISLSYSM
jgi:hypothetical protein